MELWRNPQISSLTLVLMDLLMPDLNGLETAALLRRTYPGLRIVIVSVEDTPETRRVSLAAGAHACLGKDRLPETLAHELQQLFH
jgi:DNA-binding NarL/FixJ family response regulator